jgi:MYXO-CTERM domain-containing protein
MRHALLACSAAFVTLAIVASAEAQILATPCPTDKYRCGKADIRFDQTDAAIPFEFDFDTGWTPANSPLQVRITAGLWAHTRVGLTGTLATSWPDALTIQAFGKPEDGGILGFHYGAEFEAQGRIDISVLGQDITWTGDIPYVPEFDLELQDAKTFGAWAFDPGVSISSETEPQEIASVSISDLLGSSIPGIDGGFELSVAIELQATYVTTQIVVDDVNGQPVTGGAITSEDGATSETYSGGKHVDFEVHPEGTVDYTGVLHLIPSFFISFLGSDFSIPIADIPLSIGLGATEWDFTPETVRVPLPDLRVTEREIDFGDVEVGDTVKKSVHSKDLGEADAHAALWLDGHGTGEAAAFTLHDDAIDVAPAGDLATEIAFAPEREGTFDVDLTLESNDPDDPVQLVHLHGTAHDPAPVMHMPKPGDDDAAASDDEGSCGCRAAGDDPSPAPAGALAIGLVAALAMRRRRARG